MCRTTITGKNEIIDSKKIHNYNSSELGSVFRAEIMNKKHDTVENLQTLCKEVGKKIPDFFKEEQITIILKISITFFLANSGVVAPIMLIGLIAVATGIYLNSLPKNESNNESVLVRNTNNNNVDLNLSEQYIKVLIKTLKHDTNKIINHDTKRSVINEISDKLRIITDEISDKSRSIRSIRSITLNDFLNSIFKAHLHHSAPNGVNI
jgi:hypothetical protein